MEFRRSIQRKAPRNGCTCRARNGGAAGDFGQRFVCQDDVRIQRHDDVADIFGHDLQLGARCGLGTELHDLFGNTSAVAPRPEGFVSAIALGERLDPFVEDACPFGRIDRPCLSQWEATWEKSGAAGRRCRKKTPALPALRRWDLAHSEPGQKTALEAKHHAGLGRGRDFKGQILDDPPHLGDLIGIQLGELALAMWRLSSRPTWMLPPIIAPVVTKLI